MKIRITKRLWGQASVGLGSRSSRTFPSISELSPLVNCKCFGRFMSTDLMNASSTYDETKDYSREMTVPGLKYETRVMSFGDGSSGALGHHTEGCLTDVFIPQAIEGLPTNIVRVAAGHYHSLAITEDGEVWAWGRNSEGQLGPRNEGSRQDWARPERVKGLENVQVRDVAGSGVVSMALAQDGSLWSWGSSKQGQLGLAPGVIQSKAPRLVQALAGLQVSKMALGWGHALACTNNGELYGWGYAADGRLGFNQEQLKKDSFFRDSEAVPRWKSLSRSEAAEAVDVQVQGMMENERTVIPVWEPHTVEDLACERVTDLACGMDHSLALTENGDLYSFGDNSLGQLGRPTTEKLVGAVNFPNGKSKVISFVTGLGHSLAVSLDGDCLAAPPHLPTGLITPLTTWDKDMKNAAQGSLFSWGWNSGSQLGRAGDPSLPGLVEGLAEETLIQLGAGRVHSAGLSSKRQVWIWGSGRNGRLGLGSSVDEPNPFPIETLGFWKVLQVACGFDHSLLLVRIVADAPCKGTMN